MLIDRDADRLDKSRAEFGPLGANLTVVTANVAAPAELGAAASLPTIVVKSAVARACAWTCRQGRRCEIAAWETDPQWQESSMPISPVVFTIQAFSPFMKAGRPHRARLVDRWAVGLAHGRPVLFGLQGCRGRASAPSRAGARFIEGPDQCRGAGQVRESRLARRAREGQALRAERSVGKTRFGR